MNAATTAIRRTKNVLRKQIKGKIQMLTDENRLWQSSVITKKVLSHASYCNSNTISVFLSMPDEVNTEDILENIFSNDKICFIPHYEGDVMKMVRLNSMEEYYNLPETSWKIKQPLVAEEDALDIGGLDMIIMPGLAFTTKGDRLGRGRGYYDTYLQKCIQRACKPTTLAIAFREQIVDCVPTDSSDIPVDYVITSD